MSRARESSHELEAAEADVAERVNRLYRRHRDQVFRIGLRYGGGDPTWAEDLTHDVFVSLVRKIDRIDEDDDMAGWFYRVAHNACLTRLRRQAVADSPAVRWLLRRRAQTSADLEDAAHYRQGVRRVLQAVDSLPPKQRLAFSMYHLDDKEQAEIGEILGFSRSYVCKLIKRAEAALAEGTWTIDEP